MKVKLSPQQEELIWLHEFVVVGEAQLADAEESMRRAVLKGVDIRAVLVAYQRFKASLVPFQERRAQLMRETDFKLH